MLFCHFSSIFLLYCSVDSENVLVGVLCDHAGSDPESESGHKGDCSISAGRSSRLSVLHPQNTFRHSTLTREVIVIRNQPLACVRRQGRRQSDPLRLRARFVSLLRYRLGVEPAG